MFANWYAELNLLVLLLFVLYTVRDMEAILPNQNKLNDLRWDIKRASAQLHSIHLKGTLQAADKHTDGWDRRLAGSLAILMGVIPWGAASEARWWM